jgi:lysophospholipase L1-like esterase
VVAHAAIRYVIVLEGINDIGLVARNAEGSGAEHDVLVRRMIGALEQMIARAHTHNIVVIGETIMPLVGSDYYHPTPASKADRRAINEWIRTPGPHLSGLRHSA